MTDEAALLAAIRANPDEDTPRLVFADWLQENGQTDRASFIRLQCEAFRLAPRDNENDLSTPTAEALAACKQLSSLTNLAIDWNNLRDVGATRLAASTVLPAELAMDVSFNRLTAKGIAALRERFGAGVVSEKQLV